jgi:hypothetical protein
MLVIEEIIRNSPLPVAIEQLSIDLFQYISSIPDAAKRAFKGGHDGSQISVGASNFCAIVFLAPTGSPSMHPARIDGDDRLSAVSRPEPL